MDNELTLKTGPYKTTFTGTEIIRESTPDEWKNYGEILRRVDEAKQWAIGDWLVDGMRHFEEEHKKNKKYAGTGLYEKASGILGMDESTLRKYKSLSDNIELFRRRNNLSWFHHSEAASIKNTEEIYIDSKPTGKLELSKEPDLEKIHDILSTAEKEKLSVRDLREKVRIYKSEQKEYIRLANEPDKYTVIYADPPWKYTSGNQHSDEEQETVIGTHYQSLTIPELCKLPVEKMAAENSVLFLWVTSPLLAECFDIIREWGFKYKTSMVWDKVKHNVGNYVSVRHELLLICTRGSYTPQVKELFDSVYTEERTEHSKKPSYFRDVIETIYPEGKRIELYAREKAEGWDSWGDEV